MAPAVLAALGAFAVVLTSASPSTRRSMGLRGVGTTRVFARIPGVGRHSGLHRQFTSIVGPRVNYRGIHGCRHYRPLRSFSTVPAALGEEYIPTDSSSELTDAESTAAQIGALGLVAGAAAIPHPAKVKKGGEDSYFFRPSMNGGALGVADGVGGYSEYGIDPGMFSRKLMLETANLERSQSVVDPSKVLKNAQEKTSLPGASTAVVVQLNGTSKELSYINVGDSGLRIIRDGRIFFASDPQMHSFNCPYQLAYTPLSPSAQTVADGGKGTIQVRPGDIIVVATDGVFDNLYEEDILRIAVESMGRSINSLGTSGVSVAKKIADAIAKTAFRLSGDQTYLSPFAKAKRENSNGFNMRKPNGGKPDDITVVVGIVSESGTAGFENQVEKSDSDWDEAKTNVVRLLEGCDDLMRATREALAAAEQSGMIKPAAKASGVRSARGKTEGKQLYTEFQVDKMDKASLQRALQNLGLPTSGKIAALRQRLVDYKE